MKIKYIMIPIIVVSLYYYFLFVYNITKKIIVNNSVVINNKDNINYELEDYVIGVVACEMPASYDINALKAQAIAARTFALAQKKTVSELKKSTGQCYIDEDTMKSKWGNQADKYLAKVTEAVMDTNGIIVMKNNKLLTTYYFSTSNGYTEDSTTVFKNVSSSSVESPWDKEASGYKKDKEFTKKELEKLLGSFSSIKVLKRNNTHHVEEVSVDNKKYTGIAFRHLLGLRSTDFEINVSNDTYTFTTYGYGHGVGMSQYGANALAKMDHDYEYILNYYYQNIKLENYYV